MKKAWSAETLQPSINHVAFRLSCPQFSQESSGDVRFAGFDGSLNESNNEHLSLGPATTKLDEVKPQRQ